jgi:hypothetical protein
MLLCFIALQNHQFSMQGTGSFEGQGHVADA